MWKTFNIWLFLMAVVILPVGVFALVNYYEITVQALPVLVDKNHKIQDYKLTNQEGRKVSTKDWENKIVVANFFFTNCPSICPKMITNLKEVQQTYAQNKNLLIVSFSVDPERDSVTVLKNYVTRFHINEANWNLITGSKIEIYRLARTSFKVTATDGDGGPEDFIHSDKLILIDEKKQIRGYYDGTDKKEVTQLIKDIKKLENEH